MAPLNPSETAESYNKTNANAEEYSDRPLNFYSDQVPDIKPQLRKLDLQWVAETAAENATVIASAVLAGSAIGLLMKRKFTVASFFVAGLVLQQLLSRRRSASSRPHRPGWKERKDIEMERYALKAQLGDYGKLEVIPFK